MDDFDFNPYAAPEIDAPASAFEETRQGGAWAEGKVLVMSRHAALPDRCVKCDAPAGGYRLRRNLTWHPPAWFLLILVSWLIYLIVYFIVRKTARIEVGLCDEHRGRRRNAIVAAWLVSLLGIGLIVGGIAYADQGGGPAAVVGTLVLLTGLIVAVVGPRVVYATKIDEGYIWLKGCGPAFLAGFPDLAGARRSSASAKAKPQDVFEELA